MGVPIVDLNGQRSGRHIQMNDPDAGRHHRCADLPEAEGIGGEPADAGHEVANGRVDYADADLRCCDSRDKKNLAQDWQGGRCSWNETAELRSPEREAEGLINWADKAKIAAAGALIGTRR